MISVGRLIDSLKPFLLLLSLKYIVDLQHFRLQQSDSGIYSIYKMDIYLYIHYLRFFSFIDYYKMLNIVPRAIR